MAEPTPEVTDTTTAPPEPTPTASEAEKQYGSSSYHYWHAHGKEREALGDVAPMPQARLVATEAPAEKSRRVVAISKYSWSDGKKIVSYVLFLSCPTHYTTQCLHRLEGDWRTSRQGDGVEQKEKVCNVGINSICA